VPTRDEVRRTLEDDRFRLVWPGDTEWPAGLDGLGDSAPFALWVTGAADLAMACRRSVAVTGSRAATAHGSYIASEFGTTLAERGLTVVTGGSFGIDVAAHRGAAGTVKHLVDTGPGHRPTMPGPQPQRWKVRALVRPPHPQVGDNGPRGRRANGTTRPSL
jgi:DNA recombination-mediator protein A